MLFAVATAAGGQAFSKLVSAAFPCSGTISEVLLLYLLLIGGRSPACFRACPAYANSRGLYIEIAQRHGIACCKPRI